ncbi:MAG: DoxX family protein [bacterium]
MIDMVKRVNGIFWAVVDVVKPMAPLLTRLVIGYAFVQTGIGKWQNFHDVVEFFTSLGLPAPAANAAFIASLEVVGGAALILGIGTNLFAALLSSTIIVALLTADRADLVSALSGGDKSLTDVLPVIFLMPLTWLVGFGAGPLSLDYLLKKRLGTPVAAPTKVLA